MLEGLKATFRLIWDRVAAKRFEDEAQSALRKGTDPDRAKRNISAIDASFERLKGAALRLSGVLAAAFALDRVRAFLQGSAKDFVDAEAVWNRLGGTLRTVGIDIKSVRDEIDEAAKAMQRVTTIGDEDFAAILTDLISISQDYEASMRNVQVVVDLAAAKQIDFGTAAQLVGKAMVGETGTLARYGIVVGEGVDAVDLLRERFAGMARNEAATLQGRLKQLGEATGDLKEEIGGVVVGGDDAATSIDNLTGFVRSLTDWIAEHKTELTDFRNDLVTVASLAKTPIKFAFEFTAFVTGQYAWLIRKIRDPQNLDALNADAMEHDLGFGAPDRPDAETAEMAAAKARAEEERRRQAAERVKEAAEQGRKEMEARLQAMDDTLQQWRSRFDPSLQGVTYGAPAGRMATSIPDEALPGVPDVVRERELSATGEMLFGWLSDVEDSSRQAAEVMSLAFEDAFGRIFEGGANLGDFFEALARGMAGSMLAGLAEIAQGKAMEAAAHAIEAGAKALLYADPKAAAAIPAFLAEAAAWSALAGFAGASRGAATGGGGHFGGPSTRDVGLTHAESARGAGAEVHVYVDGLNPSNPEHQRRTYAALEYARERFGDNTRVTYHPGG